MIVEIQDLTNFAKQQKNLIDSKGVSKVMVPTESVFKTQDENLNQHLGLV
jgi:hypothetical protein